MMADEQTLSRLMRAAQRGDRQSYEVLLEQSARWLHRYFRRRIAAEQIDDLVQEVLLSLHRKLSSYDPGRPFLPWLAAIARYRWIDQLRRSYSSAEVSLKEDEMAEEPGQDAVAARISLERLFDHLPEGQARAIELVKIEGQSIREAAKMCGQSESLIKVNIHRGLKKLATLVEKAN